MTKQITVGGKRVYELDADPSLGAGLVAPVGSFGMWNDAGVGRHYKKVGAGDTAWEEIVSAGALNFWEESGNDLTGAGPTTPDQVFGSNNDYDIIMQRNAAEIMRLEAAQVSYQVPVVLSGDPVADLQATTKQYVDAGLALVNASKKYRPWTKVFTADAAPVEGAALSASLPFSDDDLPNQLVIGDFSAGDYIMWDADTVAPAFGLVYDDAGTLRTTYIDVVQPAYQDDFRTQYNLLNNSDATEGVAEFYVLEDGSFVKVADQYYDSGLGILVSTAALAAVSGVILPSDSVADGFAKTNANFDSKLTKGGDADGATIIAGTIDNFDFVIHRNGALRFNFTETESSLYYKLNLVDEGDGNNAITLFDSAFLNYIDLSMNVGGNFCELLTGFRGNGEGNSPTLNILTGNADDGDSGSMFLAAGTSNSGNVGTLSIGLFSQVAFEPNSGFIRFDNDLHMITPVGATRNLNFWKNDFSATISSVIADDSNDSLTIQNYLDLIVNTDNKLATEGRSGNINFTTGSSADGDRGDFEIDADIVSLTSETQMQEFYNSKFQSMTPLWFKSESAQANSGGGPTTNWQKLSSYYQFTVDAASSNNSGFFGPFITGAATPDNVTMFKVKAGYSSQSSDAVAMFELSVAIGVTAGVPTIGTIQNDYTYRAASLADLDFTVAIIDDGGGNYYLDLVSTNGSAENASFTMTYERERFLRIDNPT
jgi:hypothetical protein